MITERIKAPYIDFSHQLQLFNGERVVEKIILILTNIAHDVSAGKIDSVGAIIVLGTFAQNNAIVKGMIQMKPQVNPINTYMHIEDDNAIKLFIDFSSKPHDGAIVVEKTGQIIGAGVYLDIEDPTLDLPIGCGTRHKAAASFSMRHDVVAVFTLSEEYNVIRMWQNGKPTRELLF